MSALNARLFLCAVVGVVTFILPLLFLIPYFFLHKDQFPQSAEASFKKKKIKSRHHFNFLSLKVMYYTLCSTHLTVNGEIPLVGIRAGDDGVPLGQARHDATLVLLGSVHLHQHHRLQDLPLTLLKHWTQEHKINTQGS